MIDKKAAIILGILAIVLGNICILLMNLSYFFDSIFWYCLGVSIIQIALAAIVMLYNKKLGKAWYYWLLTSVIISSFIVLPIIWVLMTVICC